MTSSKAVLHTHQSYPVEPPCHRPGPPQEWQQGVMSDVLRKQKSNVVQALVNKLSGGTKGADGLVEVVGSEEQQRLQPLP